MYSTYKTTLLNKLREKSELKTKKWWEGYVKGSAPFLGVKMADIRSSLHQWYQAHIKGNLELDQQLDLALALFEGETTEEKLAGTLFLQEILMPAGAITCTRDLDRLEALFSNGSIYDWNLCDWFCVKVLGPLIKSSGNACAKEISKWRDARNLWQARASLVAFVPVAEETDYYPLIERSCQTVIRREERFAKTAVGWILRDISKHDPAFVSRVVTENIGQFSVESLKNATKYFSPEEKKEFRRMLKEA